MINYKEIQLGTKTYRVGTDGSVFDLERWVEQRLFLSSYGYYGFAYPIDKIKYKTIQLHQVIAIVFLNHRLNGIKTQVDHINGIKTDNRLENLRLVSHRENQQNRRSHRSGRLVGTTFHKPSNKWVAKITNKRTINLGYFDTEQEAHQAYKNALNKLS